jgi:hypothetical protein
VYLDERLHLLCQGRDVLLDARLPVRVELLLLSRPRFTKLTDLRRKVSRGDAWVSVVSDRSSHLEADLAADVRHLPAAVPGHHKQVRSQSERQKGNDKEPLSGLTREQVSGV